MTLYELIEIYAEVNIMTRFDAHIAYDEGAIDKFDLLDAWLENEGILGYSYKFRDLFELLEEL